MEPTVRELEDLVSSYMPGLVFLMEVKVGRDHVEKVRRRIHFDGSFYVPHINHGGGLALFWKERDMVKLNKFGRNFIDVDVREEEVTWRLSCFYGWPENNNRRRRESWECLRKLKSINTLPWCVIGDFNDLLSSNEKKGGHPRPLTWIEGFSETVSSCGLMDLGMVGGKFTWERSRGSRNWMAERLDRALCSLDWTENFSGAWVRNLETASSDHSAILLSCEQLSLPKLPNFRFENSWALSKECEEIVRNCWQVGGLDCIEKLHLCAEKLQIWGNVQRSKFKSQLRECRNEIAELKKISGWDPAETYLSKKEELGRLLEQQETYWRQRAKVTWLKQGDKNSKFFHQLATERHRKNAFQRLQNHNGEWVTWGNGLEEIIQSFYSNLFTTEGAEYEHIISLIDCRISDPEKMNLCRPFEPDDVKLALFQMHPEKAPGPDGFTPGFYQKFWNIVGPEVTAFCINCLRNKSFPSDLNNTNVVLIPKKKCPVKVSDLRPISLCNVLLKIMSKMIANRIQPLMNSIISDAQSAFIPGRLITDNILIGFEVSHYIQRRRVGSRGLCSLKVDMSKAYDRVEWDFLQAMLQKLGFPSSFTDLIMLSIRTVRYKIQHRDGEFHQFQPTRGLRQGDPLSPYLFLICSEGLSALIRDRVSSGLLHGCRISPTAPVISHLLFADDSLFFFEANMEEVGLIKNIFCLYEIASGQKINFDKSSIIFSPNVSDALRRDIVDCLRVNMVEDHGLYLGLPSLIGRSKKAIYDFVLSKVMKRIHSWKRRHISQGGKEVLLKSVAQALPVYAMQVFLFPAYVIDSIEKHFSNFWWGSSVHWLRWERLCLSKEKGGLNFRSLGDFNKAMLAKQAWRIITCPHTLLSRLFKAKYFPNGSFFQAENRSNDSFVWRGIRAMKDTLKLGMGCRIGDGRSVRIWSDPWLPAPYGPMIQTPRPPNSNLVFVRSLICDNDKSWDMDLLRNLFSDVEVRAISRIPIPWSTHEDSFYWRLEQSGSFSVKSCYYAIRNQHASLPSNFVSLSWSNIWDLKVPPRVTMFLWKVATNSLPTSVRLRQKHIDVDELCSLCGDGFEDTYHALWGCPFTIPVWNELFGQGWPIFIASPVDWWCWASGKGEEMLAKAACIMWAIWSRRNHFVWNNKFRPPSHVVRHGLGFLSEWSSVNIVRSSSCQTRQSNEWRPPPLGWLKCNIDASLFDGGNRIGHGCLVRNCEGEILASRSCLLNGGGDPFLAEAMSCREALSWLKENHFDRVIIEMDALNVVTALNNDIRYDSPIGVIFSDCKSLLGQFNSCKVVFSVRSANHAAHSLARAAGSSTNRGT